MDKNLINERSNVQRIEVSEFLNISRRLSKIIKAIRVKYEKDERIKEEKKLHKENYCLRTDWIKALLKFK